MDAEDWTTEDWTTEPPTKAGIYWILGEVGGWPAISLFRVEPMPLPDGPPGPPYAGCEDVLAAARAYADAMVLHYTRIDMPGCATRPAAPWRAIAYLKVDEPDAEAVHAAVRARREGEDDEQEG